MVLAPGLLSTITPVPSTSPSFCATMRACASVPPPAVKPTTMRIGLPPRTGKSCARAKGARPSKAAAPSAAPNARRVPRGFFIDVSVYECSSYIDLENHKNPHTLGNTPNKCHFLPFVFDKMNIEIKIRRNSPSKTPIHENCRPHRRAHPQLRHLRPRQPRQAP